MASRLSYFLWVTMPDDELFALAAQGVLRDPAVLARQVDRMLASPKANTLGDIFAAQWLGFEHVGTRIWLDPIDNPWCTATLMTAMRDETSMFFMGARTSARGRRYKEAPQNRSKEAMIRNLTLGLVGAAAVVASLLLMRQQKQGQPKEVVAEAESATGSISLERMRELGL